MQSASIECACGEDLAWSIVTTDDSASLQLAQNHLTSKPELTHMTSYILGLWPLHSVVDAGASRQMWLNLLHMIASHRPAHLQHLHHYSSSSGRRPASTFPNMWEAATIVMIGKYKQGELWFEGNALKCVAMTNTQSRMGTWSLPATNSLLCIRPPSKPQCLLSVSALQSPVSYCRASMSRPTSMPCHPSMPSHWRLLNLCVRGLLRKVWAAWELIDRVALCKQLQAFRGSKVLRMMSDQGTEFVSQEFETHARQRGVRLSTSPAHQPQSNGLAERLVGLAKQCTRRLLLASNLPDAYWSYAMRFAAEMLRPQSEKVFVSQERVSGFPEKGADLRGSRGTSGEVWGTFREVWETCGEPLDCCWGSLGNIR